MSGILVRAAGFIIFRRQPQVEYLLMQTSYGKHHWTPPKGHVDPGESEFETALRETQEEAGFNREVLKLVDNFKVELKYSVQSHQDGKVRPKMTTYWLAELIDPCVNQVRLSDEHQDFKWLPLQEAKDICGYEDFSLALDKCHKTIQEL